MDRATVEVYERRGAEWAARRRPVRRSEARSFGASVPSGKLRADLGCGAGRYTKDLGKPVLAIDASRTMLSQCISAVPTALPVIADLELLPVASQVLHGGWANMSYLHVEKSRMPLALADLHRAMTVGSPLDMQVLAGDYDGELLPHDDLGGRFFWGWDEGRLCDVVTGAGFAIHDCQPDAEVLKLRAERLLSLPDFVDDHMRLLVVGLNPSVYSAERGVSFARPSNRFWAAALAAGLVSRERDPLHALRFDNVGMTDLVKRATVRAVEISVSEYRDGLARVERLVDWLAPAAVCFAGLSGWRAAADPEARLGVQSRTLSGAPVYVMPSPSGANAHTSARALAEHLRSANELASRARAR